GNWSILSGTGGTVDEPNYPSSVFTGIPGTVYMLTWTISTVCGSSADTVIIVFNPTMGTPCPGLPSFAYGGQTYNTVQIGTQCWMKENLNIGTMVTSVNTGYDHSDVSNNGIIEKYCYNNDPANCDIYGGLYDWNEMMQYTTIPGTQGICPTGWHIPTDAEWCTLTTVLDATVNCSVNGTSGTNAGGRMKETGTTHWYSPNTGATNESGFTALGAGCRDWYGYFSGLSVDAIFWSSSEYSTPGGIYNGLDYNSAKVRRYGYFKTTGFSLRCARTE
ncbi:MAG: hypothetical protein NTU44_03030, partial [Bacteroidetes bacterium]|nr:hypothetical protein [Bacteroidota bacterium]